MPWHATRMPGAVRSTVGAFRSGCPLIHATHARLCGMHAGSTGQAACPLYDATAIHRLTGTTPCVCFAASVCPRGVFCGAQGGRDARRASKQLCEGQNHTHADASVVEGIFGCRGGSFVVRTTANIDTPGSWPDWSASDSQQSERCNYPKQVVGTVL